MNFLYAVLTNAKYKFWLHSIFWKIFYKMNFFGLNIHFFSSKFHQNWFQLVGNLFLFYMIWNSGRCDSSSKWYPQNIICHKKGNNFGRPLKLRGDRNKFRRAHLWNIVSKDIFFRKNKVCLVCTVTTFEPSIYGLDLPL